MTLRLFRSIGRRQGLDALLGLQALAPRPKVRKRYLVLALLLALTWLLAPSSQAWEWLDERIFAALNGSLRDRPTWQRIVALANTRLFDLVSALGIGLVLVGHVWNLDKPRRLVGITGIAVLLATLGVSRFAVVNLGIHGTLGYHRASPSLVEPQSIRIAHLSGAWKAKDASRWSFPGDHGLVLCTLAIFLTRVSQSRPVVVLAWLCVGVMALPRLISGAHWITDIAVGSMAIGLAVNALIPIVGKDTSANVPSVGGERSTVSGGNLPRRVAA